MRPVRVNLTDITEKRFIEIMMNYFPNSTKVSIRKFFRDVKKRYYQIILDLNSGEILQALIEDGIWVLSGYYLDSVPTIDLLDEEGFHLEQNMEEMFDEEIEYIKPKPKKIVKSENIEERIDIILDKISKSGINTLTKEEVKILNKYKED